MISEIIFSDYLRTPLLCVLSMGLVFFMRNASIKKKAFAFTIYEFIVFLLYIWIFIVVSVLSEFSIKSMIPIAEWGGKWMFYFTISTILQFVIYYFLWKKNKVFTLLMSLFVVVIPLLLFNFK